MSAFRKSDDNGAALPSSYVADLNFRARGVTSSLDALSSSHFSASSFASSTLSAYERDDTPGFDVHLAAIRGANEDASISGAFTLERLWLGDGYGQPDFMVGDSIEKITGRDQYLGATFGNRGELFPEVIKIVYMPEKQKMTLITRDLRFAEVRLQ